MANLQLSEVQTAMTKLPVDDYSGRDLLQRIIDSINNGAQIDKTSEGAREIDKILRNVDYDFQVLHDWTHGELQVLMFQVSAAPSNAISNADITRVISLLAADDYSGKALFVDIMELIGSGVTIPGNSAAGIEISKILSGQSYDYDIIAAWRDQKLAEVGRALDVTRIEDFQNVINGNLIILQERKDELENNEETFLQDIEIFDRQVQALGVTADDVALYEAYIGAKMIGQIDGNGNPLTPQVGLALSGLQMTRPQKIFNSIGDGIIGNGLESFYGMVDGSYRPYESIPNTHTGGELQVQEVHSVFLTLIKANKEIQDGGLTSETLSDFQQAFANFSTDIQNMRRITVNNAFISPEFVAGLQSSGFDSFEDWFGRDFEEEGVIAKKALEGFHGVNGQPKLSLDQLAQIGLEYDFDYSLIDDASIDSILNEMRNGGPNGTPMSDADIQKYKTILEKLKNFNTQNIIAPLQDELRYLQSWEPGDHYDPYIRIGYGINAGGGVMSFDSYGPYNDPREKALMITMHLSVLHGLEKNPRWRTGLVADLLWAIDMVGLVGWEDDGAIIGAVLSILSYNMLATTIWRRASHGRLNLSSLNPGRLIQAIRSPATAPDPNAEEVDPESLLSPDDKKKLREVRELIEISKDIGDDTMRGKLEKLEADLIRNPTLAPWGSAAYANERFWNMRIFQILNAGGVRGGVFQFFFDNNSLRGPRVGGDELPPLNHGTPGTGLPQRAGDTIASYANRIANSPYVGNLLSLGNSRATAKSPIFQINQTTDIQSWKLKVLERYKKITEIFDNLKSFEKFRPDYVDDSELSKIEAEVDEMRKQFLRGNMVELDAANKPVRDADGKLKYVKNTLTTRGDRIEDFEKFIKNWLTEANTGFDLDYGKALEADAISDAERSSGNLIEDLRKAKTYAESLSNTTERETMLQRINWLENKLKETTGDVPEGVTTAPYSEHMTKTEFYQRLTLIIDKNSDFDKALTIDSLADFQTAKSQVEGSLRGQDLAHPLARLFSTEEVAAQGRQRFDWFEGENENQNSRARKLVDRVRIHAQIEGNSALIAELDEILGDAANVRAIIDSANIETHQDFKNYLQDRGAATSPTGAYDISTLPQKADLERQWNRIRFDWFNEDGSDNPSSRARGLIEKAKIQAKIDGDNDLLRKLEELEANPDKVRSLGLTRFSEFETHLGTIGMDSDYIDRLNATTKSTLETRLTEIEAKKFTLDDFLREDGKAQKVWRKALIEAYIQGNEDAVEALLELQRNPGVLVKSPKVDTMVKFTNRIIRIAGDQSLTLSKALLVPEGLDAHIRRLDARTIDVGSEGNVTRYILMGGTDAEVGAFVAEYNAAVEKNTGDAPQVLGETGRPINSSVRTKNDIFEGLISSTKWSSVFKRAVRQIF